MDNGDKLIISCSIIIGLGVVSMCGMGVVSVVDDVKSMRTLEKFVDTVQERVSEDVNIYDNCEISLGSSISVENGQLSLFGLVKEKDLYGTQNILCKVSYSLGSEQMKTINQFAEACKINNISGSKRDNKLRETILDIVQPENYVGCYKIGEEKALTLRLQSDNNYSNPTYVADVKVYGLLSYGSTTGKYDTGIYYYNFSNIYENDDKSYAYISYLTMDGRKIDSVGQYTAVLDGVGYSMEDFYSKYIKGDAEIVHVIDGKETTTFNIGD